MLPIVASLRPRIACRKAWWACWAAVLVTGRAWNWPVPLLLQVLPGLGLIAIIGVLVASGRARHYRRGRVAGAAACAGLAALDAAAVVTVLAVLPSAHHLP